MHLRIHVSTIVYCGCSTPAHVDRKLIDGSCCLTCRHTSSLLFYYSCALLIIENNFDSENMSSKSDPTHALWSAAEKGNNSDVSLAIRDGADVNSQDWVSVLSFCG